MSLVWVNGTLVDKAEARVSPFDHGFLYGDGVWEHFRAFGGKLFRPDPHLDQLFGAAGQLQIDIPLTRSELVAAIETTLRANHRTDGYVRVIVTSGPGTLGPDPRKLTPQVYILAEEYHPFPAELYGHGLHAAVWGSYDPGNPTHFGRFLAPHYLVSAKRAALTAGCLEAVISWQCQVMRGIEGNLFMVRNNRVRPIYGGGFDVMFSVAAELAEAAGIPVDADIEEQLGHPATSADLLAADEVFLAGTTCGVIGVVRLDGRNIGTGTEGPVTRAVREAYHKLTRGAG